MDLSERTTNIQRHPWETARMNMILKIIRSENMPAPKKILDIGCGDGFLLKTVSRLYPNAALHGVDIHLSKNDITDLSKGKIAAFTSLEQAHHDYDLIILMDVLEHVEHDANFLKNIIAHHATPQTRFLITVPGYQQLFSSHDTHLNHFRRYDRRMLASTLMNAGLSAGSQGTMFGSLLLPRLLTCLKEHLLAPSSKKDFKGIGQWNKPFWITKIIESAFNFDNACLWYLNKCGIPAPGLSLWATARIKT